MFFLGPIVQHLRLKLLDDYNPENEDDNGKNTNYYEGIVSN